MDLSIKNYGFVERTGVYKITILQTGEFYIGSAANLRKRKTTHLHGLKNGTHYNRILQEAYLSGLEIRWEILEYCETREAAFDREQMELDRYRGNDLLLNTSFDARNAFNGTTRRSMSKESRDRLSLERSGVSRSEETRMKIGAANRGRRFEGDTLARLRDRNAEKGRPVVIEGKHYPSVSQAARDLGISPPTVRKRAGLFSRR